MLCANGLGINRGRGRTTENKKEIVFHPNDNTVEPLKTGTLRDELKCPSYRGVRLIEVIFNRNLPLGYLKVDASLLEKYHMKNADMTVYSKLTLYLFRKTLE